MTHQTKGDRKIKTEAQQKVIDESQRRVELKREIRRILGVHLFCISNADTEELIWLRDFLVKKISEGGNL